jgi:hypothetical protein
MAWNSGLPWAARTPRRAARGRGARGVRDGTHYKVLYQIQRLCIATLKIWLV